MPVHQDSLSEGLMTPIGEIGFQMTEYIGDAVTQ